MAIEFSFPQKVVCKRRWATHFLVRSPFANLLPVFNHFLVAFLSILVALLPIPFCGTVTNVDLSRKQKILETGIGGGSNLRKLVGGVKILNFRGVPAFDPFLQEFYKKSSIWGVKSPSFPRTTFGASSPPSSVRYVLTPLSRSPKIGVKNFEFKTPKLERNEKSA